MKRGGMAAVGDEGYLWLLVALEVAALVVLRQQFKSSHGG